MAPSTIGHLGSWLVKAQVVVLVVAFLCKGLQINSSKFESSWFGIAYACLILTGMAMWPVSCVVLLIHSERTTERLPKPVYVALGLLSAFWILVITNVLLFLYP